MLPQDFFIPLYFDETEADLWLALQPLEPAQRSAFIKATLRQVLLNDNGTEALNSHSPEEDSLESEIFSLETLFAETHVAVADADYVERADNEAAEPTSSRLPWDYLLQTVIGVEDDEDVIAALKQAIHAKVQEEKTDKLPMKVDYSEPPVVDELDVQLDRVEEQEFDIESLQVATPISSTGYEYMIKHIIGIEDDEAVLTILQARNKK